MIPSCLRTWKGIKSTRSLKKDFFVCFCFCFFLFFVFCFFFLFCFVFWCRNFTNINLYWCIMSTSSISILLQKNTLWFYLLWSWLEQEIFLPLVGRCIERSSQQISSFELIRDFLFFKSSIVKALRLKSFGVLEAWSVELQRFGFVEVYGGFLA